MSHVNLPANEKNTKNYNWKLKTLILKIILLWFTCIRLCSDHAVRTSSFIVLFVKSERSPLRHVFRHGCTFILRFAWALSFHNSSSIRIVMFDEPYHNSSDILVFFLSAALAPRSPHSHSHRELMLPVRNGIFQHRRRCIRRRRSGRVVGCCRGVKADSPNSWSKWTEY